MERNSHKSESQKEEKMEEIILSNIHEIQDTLVIGFILIGFEIVLATLIICKGIGDVLKKLDHTSKETEEKK